MKGAMRWWFVIVVAIVILSPSIMDLVRDGAGRWLARETVIPNWQLAVLVLALAANWLLRTWARVKEEREKQLGKSAKRKRKGWGCLVGVIVVVTTTTLIAYRVNRSDYFPSWPVVKYWTGQDVTFYVPIQVQTAVAAASLQHRCDVGLVIAVAFSESPTYDNTSTSPSGAGGVWQFMPGTWALYWPESTPPAITSVRHAADAACRMVNDLRLAEQKSEKDFVVRFNGTDGGACWNCPDRDGGSDDPAVRQAQFAWRLWQSLKAKETIIRVGP